MLKRTQAPSRAQEAGDAGGTLRRQLVDALRQEIQEGTWAPGTKLPSRAKICAQYGVSAITVRSALSELSSDGYVVSRPRSGIVVRSDWRLASRPERNIGVLLTLVGHPFFADIMAGIDEECAANGLTLTIASSGDDAAMEAEQLQVLARRSEGLLIVPVTGEPPLAAYDALHQSGTPHVSMVRFYRDVMGSAVVTDNRLGGYLATRHLVDVGCDQIYVLRNFNDTAAIERCEGYELALREAHLPIHQLRDESMHTQLAHGEAVGYELTMRALQHAASTRGRKGRIGIFALNIQLARGVYLALKEARMEIPRDVAVVGFDDIGADYFDPPLTTMRQNLGGIGRQAVQILLREMAYRAEHTDLNGWQPEVRRLAPELIVRNSSDLASAYCLRRNPGVSSLALAGVS